MIVRMIANRKALGRYFSTNLLSKRETALIELPLCKMTASLGGVILANLPMDRFEGIWTRS